MTGFQRPPECADANDLDIETVFLEEPRLLCDKRNGLPSVGFKMHETKLDEFVLAARWIG